MEHVAKNIRRRREQLRLTQGQLGEMLGVRNETIWRYEQPDASITLNRLEQLAKALHCEPADLLDAEWDCPPPHPSFGEVGS